MRLPHLLPSMIPLEQGIRYLSICGKLIEDARFDFTPGGNIAGNYRPSGDYCPKCEEILKQNDRKFPYLYGIYPAKWIRNREGD